MSSVWSHLSEAEVAPVVIRSRDLLHRISSISSKFRMLPAFLGFRDQDLCQTKTTCLIQYFNSVRASSRSV